MDLLFKEVDHDGDGYVGLSDLTLTSMVFGCLLSDQQLHQLLQGIQRVPSYPVPTPLLPQLLRNRERASQGRS